MKSEDFIKKLENVKGFYNLEPITNAIGFSFLKDFDDHKNNYTSLLTFYISEKENKLKNKKTLVAHATYGRKAEKGVYVRNDEEFKFSDPVDIISTDEYYYDIENDKFFKKNREISLFGLIDDFYGTHIKNTKILNGALIRMKIFFWKIIIAKFFKTLSKFFYWMLYLISGNKYSYEPIWKTEILNNVVISSTFKDTIGLNKDGFKEDLTVEELEFLGYKAPLWSILFYSLLHLMIYFIFNYINYKPDIIVNIFENNFLTLAYVVLSLWFIEQMLPNILKFLIKSSSERFKYFSYLKEIKI